MASSAAKTRDQVATVFHLRFDWLRSGLSFLDQSQCTVEEIPDCFLFSTNDCSVPVVLSLTLTEIYAFNS